MENYKTNNELNQYDYVEGIESIGLVPKLLEKLDTIGLSDKSSKLFEFHPQGGNSLEVIDIDELMSGSEEEIKRPTPTENTEHEQEIEDEISTALTDPNRGTAAYTAVYDEVNNITIPSDSMRNASISGAVQNGATITNESSGKSMTILNTSEEPSDVNVITEGGSVYLRGEYNNIYLEGKSLPVASSIYPNVHGTVSIADTDQPVSISVNFVGDDCGVRYLGDEELTITDGVTGETASPTIYAPNATVKMNGKYDDVVVTVSENTLILNGSFHAKKLTVLKGNIFVNGVDINDFVNELIIPEGCVITYAEYHVSQDNYSKLFASSPANGKVILDTNIEVTRGRQLGVIASGKEVIDLNGHELRCGDTRAESSNTGSLYMRGSAQIDIMDSVGGGKFINNHNDYLCWVNGADNILNIRSGEYQGYVHVLYSFQGTINVYGGTFKMLGENTDIDVNGNYKFLLNCKDEHYTDGTAHINVYGGKFYQFNPSVAYSEPGGPVSFVPEGYHVVESVEDGIKVYEVVENGK